MRLVRCTATTALFTVSLAAAQEMAVHATQVMSTVDYVIANLRNLGPLIPILQDNHSRHIGVRKLS